MEPQPSTCQPPDPKEFPYTALGRFGTSSHASIDVPLATPPLLRITLRPPFLLSPPTCPKNGGHNPSWFRLLSRRRRRSCWHLPASPPPLNSGTRPQEPTVTDSPPTWLPLDCMVPQNPRRLLLPPIPLTSSSSASFSDNTILLFLLFFLYFYFVQPSLRSFGWVALGKCSLACSCS